MVTPSPTGSRPSAAAGTARLKGAHGPRATRADHPPVRPPVAECGRHGRQCLWHALAATDQTDAESRSRGLPDRPKNCEAIGLASFVGAAGPSWQKGPPPMNPLLERISIDPAVCSGRPCITTHPTREVSGREITNVTGQLQPHPAAGDRDRALVGEIGSEPPYLTNAGTRP